MPIHARKIDRDNPVGTMARKFLEHPGVWFDSYQIHRITGSLCVGTLVSEIRTQIPGQIECRRMDGFYFYRYLMHDSKLSPAVHADN